MDRDKQIEQSMGDIKVIIRDTIYSISNEEDRKYITEILCDAGYRKTSEVVEEIFGEIFALCDNAEDKLDKLFNKANDYRKGYENSVKHFKDNMAKLKKKYTEGKG